MNVRRRGGEVIVINPVVETGLVNFSVPSDRAQPAVRHARSPRLYVQPHIGGDLALLTGIAKRIVEMGAHRRAVPRRPLRKAGPSSKRGSRTSRGTRSSPRAACRASEIDEIAERYAAAKNVVFSWTMGITHHAHGVRERAGDRQPRPAARHGRPAAAPA